MTMDHIHYGCPIDPSFEPRVSKQIHDYYCKEIEGVLEKIISKSADIYGDKRKFSRFEAFNYINKLGFYVKPYTYYSLTEVEHYLAGIYGVCLLPEN